MATLFEYVKMIDEVIANATDEGDEYVCKM